MFKQEEGIETLIESCYAAMLSGDMERAESELLWAKELIEIHNETSTKRAWCVYVWLGQLNAIQGRQTEAELLANRLLSTAETCPRGQDHIVCMSAAASIFLDCSNYIEAERHFRSCLADCEEYGSPLDITMMILQGLIRALMAQGNKEDALAFADLALAL